MEIFNPRNSMMISRNDGYFANDYNWFKDMLINSQALVSIGRDNYSKDQLDTISNLKKKYHH